MEQERVLRCQPLRRKAKTKNAASKMPDDAVKFATQSGTGAIKIPRDKLLVSANMNWKARSLSFYNLRFSASGNQTVKSCPPLPESSSTHFPHGAVRCSPDPHKPSTLTCRSIECASRKGPRI